MLQPRTRSNNLRIQETSICIVKVIGVVSEVADELIDLRSSKSLLVLDSKSYGHYNSKLYRLNSYLRQ